MTLCITLPLNFYSNSTEYNMSQYATNSGSQTKISSHFYDIISCVCFLCAICTYFYKIQSFLTLQHSLCVAVVYITMYISISIISNSYSNDMALHYIHIIIKWKIKHFSRKNFLSTQRITFHSLRVVYFT